MSSLSEYKDAVKNGAEKLAQERNEDGEGFKPDGENFKKIKIKKLLEKDFPYGPITHDFKVLAKKFCTTSPLKDLNEPSDIIADHEASVKNPIKKYQLKFFNLIAKDIADEKFGGPKNPFGGMADEARYKRLKEYIEDPYHVFWESNEDKDAYLKDLKIALTPFFASAKIDAFETIKNHLKLNMEHASASEHATNVVRNTSSKVQEPNIEDWKKLANKLKTKKGPWCSLIYDYWLDESGIFWSIERLADRFENGINKDTRQLSSVHINPGDVVSEVLDRYIGMQNKHDFSSLAKREKQYLFHFDFPLRISTSKNNRIQTVDPRSGFPGLFHRFLYESTRYYDQLRDKEKEPKFRSAQKAAEALGRNMAGGTENLHTLYPPVLGGELEFIKSVYTLNEFQNIFINRPGLDNILLNWEKAVENIRNAYGWRRQSIREYRKLAESGEAILAIIQVLQKEIESMEGGEFQAVLQLLQNQIEAYVYSYNVVSQVNLEKQADPRSPAEAMQDIKGPSVPPVADWANRKRRGVAAG